MQHMTDWNVVVSVRNRAYTQARRLLAQLGEVGGTDYYNVLVLRVDDITQTMNVLRVWCETNPEILTWLGHFLPMTVTFNFQSPAEFEAKGRQAARQWLGQLAGKRFHVRVERRGFRQRIDSADVERLLGAALIAALEQTGASAQVAFRDADAVLLVETVGQRAGLALWTRADIERYPFLGLHL